MEEQKTKSTDTVLGNDIINVIKKNIVLILIIVIVAGIVGGIYSSIRKPTLVVYQKLNYVAELIDDDVSVLNNVTVMEKYLNTVQDFFKQDVVFDRANNYWAQYSNNFKDKYTDKDALLEFEKAEKNYTVSTGSTVYYDLSLLDIYKNDVEETFCFYISYKGKDLTKAIEMLKVYSLAFADEIDAENGNAYFEGIHVIISDLGFEGHTDDISNKKIILLFLLVGLMLAFVLVIVKFLLNNTIRTASEMEEITGVSVLGSIVYQDGVKNGK